MELSEIVQYKRDSKEIFDYKETPVVSLPQFVIDRIKPCVEAYEDGLTFEGAVLCVNGRDSQGHPVDESNGLPMGLPEITPEFIEWRDNFAFKSLRQMKIAVALIYRYKLEDNE
ncbi:hypothetical protein [Companilactobacillus musae]|uniref:hypothetical protein n=1 Tax=Companilactobacillus musae TaxID=1903258 RepID=UPI000E658A61|nr:hypothetical protein [Companilactobacillus musae]